MSNSEDGYKTEICKNKTINKYYEATDKNKHISFLMMEPYFDNMREIVNYIFHFMI